MIRNFFNWLYKQPWFFKPKSTEVLPQPSPTVTVNGTTMFVAQSDIQPTITTATKTTFIEVKPANDPPLDVSIDTKIIQDTPKMNIPKKNHHNHPHKPKGDHKPSQDFKPSNPKKDNKKK